MIAAIANHRCSGVGLRLMKTSEVVVLRERGGRGRGEREGRERERG